MENIICACGHSNPYGTKLCEKCGRPLTEEGNQTKVVDMRYDGTAIRSKTYNKSIVDKIWNFFSSVKVGITLIITLLIAASIGTIFPQEFYVKASEAEKGAYYEKVYGIWGKIYYESGLSDLYSSWWFQILVGMLGISIIVASLDRGIPLYKSLKNQRVKRHESFMKRQRIVAEGQVTGNSEEILDKVEKKMQEMKYNVRRDGSALLAEKGRFSRFGPYINHVGLIIFLGGVMIRLIPGFYVDEAIWVREGETRAIPGMDGYFVENKKFILETHDNKPQGEQVKQGVNVVAKNFQTDVALYKQPEGAMAGDTENLEKVKDYSIRVNHPLKEEGYAIYQMDYQLNELKQMNFELVNKKTEESLGKVEIDLTKPQDVYDLGNGASVKLLDYQPDFSGFKDGVPQTASSAPNNPAFLFQMNTPDKPKGETSFVAIKNTIEPLGENEYKMKFIGVETRNVSGLTIRKDKTIPILFVGGIIFMIGVAIGSYWNHRRLWLQVEPDGRVVMAAHVNKNMFSMKKDLNAVTAFAGLPQYVDQLEAASDDEKSTNSGEKEKEGDNSL